MINLVTNKQIAESSSKGNQEKWFQEEENRWYKLDLFGYEILAETVISVLLEQTNIKELGFQTVRYQMETIQAHGKKRIGCSSENFLKPEESLITLASLLKKGFGPDWQQKMRNFSIPRKIEWITKTVQDLTGLEHFGQYLTLLFEIDLLFVNDDRHLNNIAVLRQGETFSYCPLFDFGAGLLSNIRDYPLDTDIRMSLAQAKSLPFDCSFVRQVHGVQSMYGPQLKIHFTSQDILDALEKSLSYYSKRDIPFLKDRIVDCIRIQRKKLGQ